MLCCRRYDRQRDVVFGGYHRCCVGGGNNSVFGAVAPFIKGVSWLLIRDELGKQGCA